jgi:hypothetical protein
LKIDLRQMRELADDLGVAQDQVRFAASKTLNDGLFQARDELADVTWPRHVEQRNPQFPKSVLHLNRASKSNLHVELVETKGSILEDHDKGAVRHAAHRFAVPTTQYRAGKMTQHGLAARARPAANRSVRIMPDGRVFIATKGQRLKLAFVLKPSVNIKADVPLTQAFVDTVLRTFDSELESNLLRAMKTRFT